MKQTKLAVAIKATLLGASVALAPAAFAADKELLDILKANGAISAEQYTELSMENMMAKNSRPSDSTLKKMAWAGKIKIKGDLRARHETRSSTGGFSDKDRQRVRARIGIYADVASNVEAGVRLATGGDNTSANQTLGQSNKGSGDFTPKDIFLDLAYINWQPLNGLEVIGGKFKKPWEQVSGGLVWDGDLNPEGIAFRYTTNLAGAKLIASAGSLVAGQSSDGQSTSEDRKVVFGQLAAKFKVAGAKTKVGVSIYDFDNGEGDLFAVGKGNSTGETFQLTELFAETKVDLGLPVKFYGHYVTNNNEQVTSGEDTAWLLGAQAKMGKWKASYDYRDIEKNSVYAPYNDSDFADGYSDSKGSMLKLSYAIDKNFSIGTAYIDAESGSTLGSKANQDVDTWQIDLKAKF